MQDKKNTLGNCIEVYFSPPHTELNNFFSEYSLKKTYSVKLAE